MSPKCRAPAPALSSDHLNAARSIAISETGSRSSGYLTPPVSGPRSMSPPPRTEADDYLNAHLSRRDGRAYYGRQTRKHHNTREYSGEMSPSVRSLPLRLESKSHGGRCNSCGTSSIAGDAESASDSPLLESVRKLKLQTTFHECRPDTKADAVHAQARRSPESPFDEPEVSETPAVLALRSLTMPRSEIENRAPQALRRMSTALSNTYDFLKSRTPTMKPSRKVSKEPEDVQRRRESHGKKLSRQNSYQSRPTFRDSKGLSGMLGTPAAITLRKASNVYAPTPVMSSMAASIISEDIREATPEAPVSELLAFYSTPTLMIRGMKPTKATSPESNISSSSITTETSSTLNPSAQPMQKKSMSIVRFNKQPSVRRFSDPAEATLTFADVYVAAGSFAVEPNSRKDSLVPGEALRRISVVHFKSRNSVHEVIWREDETTSGSSLSSGSRASASPKRHDGISRSGTPSPEERPKSSHVTNNRTKAQHGYLPPSPTTSSQLGKPQDRLFQWSWRTLSSAAKDTLKATELAIEPSRFEYVKSSSDPGIAEERTSPEPQEPRYRRSSTLRHQDLTDIQSFLPLRPRSSTSEWRWAPLVDLNDPLAGHVHQ